LRERAKVIARIFGGLGNQLFCYAAARRLALASDTELVLDDVSGFARDETYQRRYQLHRFNVPCRRATPMERLEPFPRLRRLAGRTLNRWRPFQHRAYIQQETLDFDARLLEVRPRGTLYLQGYWQSEGYFKDVEPRIREDLQITGPSDDLNVALAEQIRGCRSVAVHVRFFDAPREAGVNNAPVEYYTRAFAYMDRALPDAHYFVFTDQPAAALDRIPRLRERVTLVSHNRGDDGAVADLWLMTQCQHFIIANSTFSWWGAWLAGHVGKQVIAPGFEMRSGKMWWGFEGLLPEAWIKL
jgi:hypothetical protein